MRKLKLASPKEMTEAEFLDLRDRLLSSGVPQDWQTLLNRTTGRKRVISVLAMCFVYTVVGRQENHRMYVICAARVLNDLTAAERRALGITHRWSQDATYHRLVRLQKDLAKQLRRERVYSGKSVLAGGFSAFNRLIACSIDPGTPRSTAVAIDGTYLEGWAKPAFDAGNFDGNEKLLPRQKTDPRRPKSTPPRDRKPLAIGADGRGVYTLDPDARFGHRSGNSSRDGGFFHGYHLHIAAQVSDVVSHSFVDVTLGPDVPRVVRAMSVVPANVHDGWAVLPAIRDLRNEGPGLTEVIVDRGYSNSIDGFLYPVRALGVEPVFDLMKVQRGVRPFKTEDLLIDGQLYSRLMPEALRYTNARRPLPLPARNATPDERAKSEQLFNARMPYRMVRHSGPSPAGSIRLKCPIHAGLLKSRDFPSTMRRSVNRPIAPPTGRTKCCDGIITVEAAEVPLLQRYHVGTTAWAKAYRARRNIVENVNSSLQSQFSSLSSGHIRVMGLEENALLMTFTIMGFNTEVQETWRREAAARPKVRKRRRTGTLQDLAPDWADPLPVEAPRSPRNEA